MSKSKDKGTAFETAIVRYLREVVGDDEIDRMPLKGERDEGDVRGLKLKGARVCVEIKNCKTKRVDAWMGELAYEMGNMDAEIGLLISHRDGCGQKRIGLNDCYMTLGDAVRLSGGLPLPHGYQGETVIRMTLDDALRLAIGKL